MDAICCKGLNFRYNTADKPVLADIGFTVDRGELVMLMGRSGCGKTTLLKLLKPEISPLGELSGETEILGSSTRAPQPKVGFVPQHPEDGFVSDTVRGEIMFAPENAGLEAEEVRRLTAETVSRFGLGRLFERRLSTLSGGEKQLVSLCSAMVMQPDVLLLDEPLSRLDPVTAESFASLILRVQREFGTTVIIAEHSSELLFAECDRVLFMEDGRLTADCPPREASKLIPRDFLPAAAGAFFGQDILPLTVHEGRELLSGLAHDAEVTLPDTPVFTEEALSAQGLYHSFGKNSEDILSGADITLHKGEHMALIGANGSGKTTLLRCLSGTAKTYSGKVKVFGRPLKKSNTVMAMLPQEVTDIFLQQTVLEDYRYALNAMDKPAEKAEEMLEKLGISHLSDMHPYDLSGGELQLCGLGRVLLCEPEILLLDEPSKGLDNTSAQKLGELISKLCADGMAALTVTHSLEFAANHAHTCGILCAGRTESVMSVPEFFSKAGFYSTAAGRIARGLVKNAYTAQLLRQAVRI